MEAPGNDGSISVLDTKCCPNLDHTKIPVKTEKQPTLCVCYQDLTITTQFQPKNHHPCPIL